MEEKRFERWLKNIFTTQEEEISCSECFELVSRFVELEFSGGNPEMDLPQVKQHLSQCRACGEEYETLHDLRRLEEEGNAPSLDDLRNSIH